MLHVHSCLVLGNTVKTVKLAIFLAFSRGNDKETNKMSDHKWLIKSVEVSIIRNDSKDLKILKSTYLVGDF